MAGGIDQDVTRRCNQDGRHAQSDKGGPDWLHARFASFGSRLWVDAIVPNEPKEVQSVCGGKDGSFGLADQW